MNVLTPTDDFDFSLYEEKIIKTVGILLELIHYYDLFDINMMDQMGRNFLDLAAVNHYSTSFFEEIIPVSVKNGFRLNMKDDTRKNFF